VSAGKRTSVRSAAQNADNRKAILANYYETLSLNNVDRFVNAINSEASDVDKAEINSAEGFKVIKIYGTKDKLDQVYHSLDILGVEFEELEDGMPGAPREVFEPVFDSFVAFDTENSGTYGGKDKPAALTEIGAVKVINGQIIESRDWLINPKREIIPRIARMTRIDNEMVKDKPTIDTVIKEFKEFVGDLPFVGHNIKAADLRFIIKDGEENGIAFENEFFDTNKYAKKIKDKAGFKDTKLEYLAGYFGVTDEGHHRADNDAKVNAEVYLKMKKLQ
jgi:DNA polymerase-3 subunit alpha (Gram-positive type)